MPIKDERKYPGGNRRSPQWVVVDTHPHRVLAYTAAKMLALGKC